MAVPNVVYNINVKSKFELFLDDDFCEAEPEELVKKLTEEKKKKELAHKEAKKQKQNENKKSISKPTVESEPPRQEGKVSGERSSRFPKSESKPKNVSQRTIAPVLKTEYAGDDETSEDKKHGGKEKKSFGNAPKRRGREFDRHSGSDKTGVKSVERRDGSGSYNWGNVKDIVDLSQEFTLPEPKEEVLLDEKLAPTEVESEKKEPGKPVMTMSEWKALQGTEKIISSHVPTRPANNGENVFTGMNAYQKKSVHQNESDNEVVVVDDETDSKGRRQIKVNIEFSGSSRRGRAGFNPRSRRDDNGRAIKDDGVINLDEEEFPTLS